VSSVDPHKPTVAGPEPTVPADGPQPTPTIPTGQGTPGHPAGTPFPSGSGASPAVEDFIRDHPEALAGAAFVGGLLGAKILKRITGGGR
jgi:hypothetical protein